MASSQMKALVLGGKTGLLGRSLVAALEARGWAVTSAGSANFDYYSNNFSDTLAALVDQAEPNCLFNAVGYTQVDMAEEHEDEAMLLNRGVPAAIGRVTKSRPVQVVHFSTDFVFDGRKKTPYTVNDAPAPASVYGKSKLAGEQLLMSIGLYGLCVIRTAWLFGPGKKNFVDTILQLCQDNGSARVVFDQIGSPTYTVDLAQYTLDLLEVGASGLFHIVNSGEASWCELAAEAVNYSQMECPITPVSTADFQRAAQRPAYSVLDTTSFTQMTGIVPRPWPQALREYLMTAYPGS